MQKEEQQETTSSPHEIPMTVDWSRWGLPNIAERLRYELGIPVFVERGSDPRADRTLRLSMKATVRIQSNRHVSIRLARPLETNTMECHNFAPINTFEELLAGCRAALSDVSRPVEVEYLDERSHRHWGLTDDSIRIDGTHNVWMTYNQRDLFQTKLSKIPGFLQANVLPLGAHQRIKSSDWTAGLWDLLPSRFRCLCAHCNSMRKNNDLEDRLPKVGDWVQFRRYASLESVPMVFRPGTVARVTESSLSKIACEIRWFPHGVEGFDFEITEIRARKDGHGPMRAIRPEDLRSEATWQGEQGWGRFWADVYVLDKSAFVGFVAEENQ